MYMDSLNGKTSEEEPSEKNDESDLFIPTMVIKCPSSSIKKTHIDPSEKTIKSLSRLYLTYSCVKVCNGYELSLKGERVYKKLGRRINDLDLPIILSHVASEGDILSLDLANNMITDSGFYMFCQFLLNSNLKNLNLRNNEIVNLSEKGCEMLGRVTCLKRLTLSGNHLAQKSAESLKLALKANKSLEVLELEGVDFYVHCVNRITDALIESKSNLKVLNISRLLGIPRYRLRSYYLADMLYALLVANPCLVELHVEKNAITDHDLIRLVEGLKRNRTLVVLNLTANFIGNVGLERIALILPKSNLQVLLLRSNKIGNQGAIALSKAMPLSKILHLDLAHNRIEDVGFANLLWTIKKPTPLYTFYIVGNNFTKQTLEIIHVQMLRGKIIPDSLDIVLYWEEDGSIRCSHNPDAEEYRKQMAGLFDGSHTLKKNNLLSYPIINVLEPYNPLISVLVHYPSVSNPKILSHYKDHIGVK
ncbi:unnamed protein product [Nezara viridula]|uniref:Leucine-rich repeat-containing protein 34-like n=1 Tax=Nezara viridula TaxID=85310 RepID=A0A9P0HL31_NEZVI|nr:unnamed protein product [Nezara viridula]